MRNLLYLVIVVIAVASCAILRADDAVASLGHAKLFAFGGIGVAGTKSEGEKLFERVMASPDALTHFRSVLKSGTSEGRLYALCGLRALDKAAFTDSASSMKSDTKTTVQTAAGCMISHQLVSSVVSNIEKGNYDHYLSKKRAE